MKMRADDFAEKRAHDGRWWKRVALPGIVLLLSAAAAAERPSPAAPSRKAQTSMAEWPIVELRQYTLKPGKRDTLIQLFEAEFIESQEALGMMIPGTFRDLDKPDRFVWLRAFKDMPSRAEGLQAFYSGPVWQAHKAVANATMVDSDNVLLLRAARPGSGFTSVNVPRPAKGASDIPHGLVVANIYYFETAVDPAFVEFFERTVRPELKATGVTVRAAFMTETSANNFPALPIRASDRVFVWFSSFSDQADYDRRLAALGASPAWKRIAKTLRQKLKAPPEVLRLQPTPRSQLHG